MINKHLTELANAAAEDEAAKREALEVWLMATKPLSVTRLRQLCALGERMMAAASRKARAEVAAAKS